MAQAGYTPIQLYFSTTAAAVPLAANLAQGELAINIVDGKLYYENSSGVVTLLASAAGASGDVVGPASATDNAVARFDGTTGKLIQNGVVIIGDTGAVTGVTDLTASGNLTLSGGTANGVAYLNGSKVVTSGSALTFDGANIIVNATTPAYFTGTSNLAQVSINRSPSTGAIFNASQSAAYLNIDGASGGSSFQFVVASAANTQPSEQMRLTSTGLGIGTSSPANKLDVNNTGGSTTGGIRVYATDQAYARLNIQNANGQAYHLVAGTAGASNSGFGIYDATAGATRVQLDSSGNLGLGVTPSAWSGYKVLQAGIASFAGGSSGAYLIQDNAYTDNSGAGWKYINSGYAAAQYYAASGAHVWRTAASGTAGNAITFTQAMTLDASGNLGVGETSPTSRLHVSFTSNSVDNVLQIQQKGNNTASGLSLAANDNNGAGYNFIRSLTTGGTTHWQISGGVATSTMAFSTGGTERARINSLGNLLIGQTSAGAGARLEITGVSSAGEVASFTGTSALGTLQIFNQPGVTNRRWGIPAGQDAFIWTGFNSGAYLEQMRLDNTGNLLVGTTSVISAGKYSSSFNGSVSNGIILQTTLASSGSTFIGFINSAGSTIGSINQNATSTVIYNTSSDYRLKNITGALTGYKERLMSLQPKQGTWIADGSEFRGFLAHEFANPYRASVTGEKDAVDDDGKPIYQGMQASSSEVMADLVAMVNELITENASLKARLDAANL